MVMCGLPRGSPLAVTLEPGTLSVDSISIDVMVMCCSPRGAPLAVTLEAGTSSDASLNSLSQYLRLGVKEPYCLCKGLQVQNNIHSYERMNTA